MLGVVLAASGTAGRLFNKTVLIVSHRNGRRPGGGFGARAGIANPSCEGWGRKWKP